MADHSAIEWTDATWNVITGCSIESPGCTNCYAMKLAGTRLQHHPSRAGLTKPSAAGPVWTGEVRFNEDWLDQPSRWRKPREIFVCAHGDLFHPSVPDEWLDRVFMQMQEAAHHTFQVLTKRPERALQYLAAFKRNPAGEGYITRGGVPVNERPSGSPVFFPRTWPLQHVLIGASVESQRYADERRGPLSNIAAAGWRTWVSYEPALGPVDWSGWEFMRWMVSGGESGAGARPSHPDWHRVTRDYCAAHGIAYHFKQWGEYGIAADGMARNGDVFRRDGEWSVRIGKKAAGRLLDGITHDGFPS